MNEINFVKKCLHDNKVSSKVELINFLKIHKIEEIDYTELIEFFKEYLFIAAEFSFENMSVMIGPKKGLSYLTILYLINYCKLKNKGSRLKILNYLLDFYDTLSESKSSLLTIASAKNLLNIVADFGIRDGLLLKDWATPLTYIFIPYKCSEKNAEFSPYPPFITIFKPKIDTAFSAEYVFLHEIGHVMQVHFTKNSTMVPESFNEWFPNIKKQDAAEVFADFFTVAVMMDSAYSIKNPFIKTGNRIFQKKIQDYFHNLLS